MAFVGVCFISCDLFWRVAGSKPVRPPLRERETLLTISITIRPAMVLMAAFGLLADRREIAYDVMIGERLVQPVAHRQTPAE